MKIELPFQTHFKPATREDIINNHDLFEIEELRTPSGGFLTLEYLDG
jgi:hypothetical protein